MALLLALGSGSCRGTWGGLDIDRETQTSGDFRSTGWSIEILGWEIPRDAMLSARDNIADARLDHVVVEETSYRPHFGYLDWILHIFSVRFASIEGTWGFDGG